MTSLLREGRVGAVVLSFQHPLSYQHMLEVFLMDKDGHYVIGGRCQCTALRKATRRVTQLYDKVLTPSGLKATQRAILAEIGRARSANVGALAEALVWMRAALRIH
jgi:hypothetical protein